MDTNFFHSPAFLAIPVVCAALAAFIYRYGVARPLPGIPHDPYHWFFGHLKEVLAAAESGLGPALLCSQHALRNGPVCQVMMGPLKNLVILTDPQEADVS